MPLLFFILLLGSCKSEQLYKISRDKLLEMHQKGNFNVDDADLKTFEGNELKEEDVQRLKNGEFACDYAAV